MEFKRIAALMALYETCLKILNDEDLTSFQRGEYIVSICKFVVAQHELTDDDVNMIKMSGITVMIGADTEPLKQIFQDTLQQMRLSLDPNKREESDAAFVRSVHQIAITSRVLDLCIAIIEDTITIEDAKILDITDNDDTGVRIKKVLDKYITDIHPFVRNIINHGLRDMSSGEAEAENDFLIMLKGSKEIFNKHFPDAKNMAITAMVAMGNGIHVDITDGENK